jgi:hypothetical protein
VHSVFEAAKHLEFSALIFMPLSVSEVPRLRENHGHVMLIGRLNNFRISD